MKSVNKYLVIKRKQCVDGHMYYRWTNRHTNTHRRRHENIIPAINVWRGIKTVGGVDYINMLPYVRNNTGNAFKARKPRILSKMSCVYS